MLELIGSFIAGLVGAMLQGLLGLGLAKLGCSVFFRFLGALMGALALAVGLSLIVLGPLVWEVNFAYLGGALILLGAFLVWDNLPFQKQRADERGDGGKVGSADVGGNEDEEQEKTLSPEEPVVSNKADRKTVGSLTRDELTLVTYIKQGRETRKTNSQITLELRKMGWPIDGITAAFQTEYLLRKARGVGDDDGVYC